MPETQPEIKIKEPANRLDLDSEVESLRVQIQANCHRSDARFSGSFSLCGLLLRLRDYYKWEQGLPPWGEADTPRVLSWIEAREELWDRLTEEELKHLTWRGRNLDPFDSDGINTDLARQGWYYCSGYAAFLKPSFFLGRVYQRESLNGFEVVYLDNEIARDLFTVPAMTRDSVILARLRPLAAYVWDSILHAGASRRKAMDMALAVYGLSRPDLSKPAPTWAPRLTAMLKREIEPFVRHEYGEATDQTFPRKQWQTIISGYPHTRIELMARTIKDLLADTGDKGRLKFIIENGRVGSLGVFLAQLDGMPARLFPEIQPAFDRFLRNKDWREIETARLKARDRAQAMACDLLELLDRSKGDQCAQWLTDQVEKVFYQPLGL